MTQIADQLKQKVRGLVGFPATLSSSPTSNRADSSLHTSTSVGEISVISKPAVLHEKFSSGRVFQQASSPDVTLQQQQNLNAEEKLILEKIEEQNRLLEADRKSLKSVSSDGTLHFNPSRRSSNGSVSPTSISIHSCMSSGNDTGNSNTGYSLDASNKAWNLWGKVVNDWDEYKKKNGKQLKEMIRCGIPHHFRGLVWQLLCNAHNSMNKKTYADLIRQTSPSEKLIRRDIARTYPNQDFFKEKDGVGQEVLFNVIKAYSLLDREVGYCQGSAFIVGLILMQMPEEEAFAVFVALMKDYNLRELFKPSMTELGLCMYQLENMLQDHAPELMGHFQAQAFHTSMFASSWFLTLFATFFDITLASRIMDVYISEGMEIIFRIGLALLLSSQTKLMELDMEGMLKYIQKDLSEYYNKEPDLLFQRAFLLVKYNAKKMKRLEKEYMTKMEREQEEQVEIRRLRTENRLLRQRIDSLEVENGTLADKLIQDRVNRALEAEEKIIMGKELSIAKRQAMLSQSTSPNPHVVVTVTDGRSLETKTSTHPNYSEAFVVNLQQELVQSKKRETDAAARIAGLQEKLCDLAEKNRELTDQSKVTSLQEELVAAKLREAELNGSMKELAYKLHMLEDNWQKHMNRTSATRRSLIHSKSGHNSKAALQEVQEELMTAQFKETKLIAQNADTRQKLMDLETANQIYTGQLRRSDEERSNLKERLRVIADNEKVLKEELMETKARIAKTESKNQEALIALRIREADNTVKIAELEETICNLKMKKIEEIESLQHAALPTAPSIDSTKIIHQLQSKVLKQQRQIDRMRRQLSNCDVEASNDEVDALSDVSDDSELLFNATLTAESVSEPAFGEDDDKKTSVIQDEFSLMASGDASPAASNSSDQPRTLGTGSDS